jgi:hypothetical protein
MRTVSFSEKRGIVFATMKKPKKLGRRTQTHCMRGHELTPANCITRKRKGRIERQCRTCVNAYARRTIRKAA